MKTKLYILVLSFLLAFVNSNAQMVLKSVPEKGYPGIQLLLMEDGTRYLSRQLIDVRWDENKSIFGNVITKTNELISVKIPADATLGFHTIKVIMDDNVEGVLPFEVVKKPEYKNNEINGYDPDPNTQNGKPVWAGKNPKGIKRGQTVYNPSGGRGAENIPCDKMHVIDGIFTDSLQGGRKEWSNILPLQGTFANLYLDYCDSKGIMYLMNDWKLGKGNYDTTTCYNQFEFLTGNGSEKWWVKVWNSTSKGIEVIRNGIDVSEDTNFVVGGKYGFDKSLLEDSAHTMWEFGLKTQGGIYVMWIYRDEAGSYSIGDPKVRIICDDDGYGTVQSPEQVSGYLGNGSRVYMDDRYIPINGVAGLETEPNVFSGRLFNDTATVRTAGNQEKINSCSGKHVIDGLFTPGEWDNSKPAVGKYSNLYADYCDGVLYILNDWMLGAEEPDEMNCYNLFELYTGDVTQHWGIFVYHDTAKSIKVFLNGEDVSNDTNIVMGGRFNFAESPNLDKAHTIYEFAIKANEGNWHMFMCDPGPASFCDDDPRPAPRTISPKTGVREEGQGSPGDHSGIIPVNEMGHSRLVVGTGENTHNWFSRKFEATVKFNPDVIHIAGISLPASNLIAADLQIEVDSTTPGLYKVYGTSENNFSGAGDLFVLDVYVETKSGSIKADLQIDVKLANRTTYMRQFRVPDLIFDITSSVDDYDNNKLISSINLYPNPNRNANSSVLEFNLLKREQITVELFNVIGKRYVVEEGETFPAGVNRIQLNADGLPQGVYFVRVKSNTFARVIKFEIIK